MSQFNKEGLEFTHLVSIDRDPNQDTTYSHKFPTYDFAKHKIVERWSTKVKPIKSLTESLRGIRLKRNKDYMVDYNNQTQKYEYWFAEGQNATLFALMCATMKQGFYAKGQQFDISCPHCGNGIKPHEVTWQ